MRDKQEVTQAASEAVEAQASQETYSTGPNRRQFLASVGGLAAAAALVPGNLEAAPAIGNPLLPPSRTDRSRRSQKAYQVRVNAANALRRAPLVDTPTNGDETAYSNHIGSFSKSLPHDSLGIVSNAAYLAFVQACADGTAASFENVPAGGSLQLKNPLAAYAFALEGIDPHNVFLPAPPAFSSAQIASEMAECYWHALVRDVPFADYGTDPMILAACTDLSGFSDFRGPRIGGVVAPSTVFRGNTNGDLNGPYLSQFLLKDMQFGNTMVPQLYRTTAPNSDFNSTYPQWLDIQDGKAPQGSLNYLPNPRYIATGRDLAHYVHNDFPYESTLCAVLALIAMGAPVSPSNPYNFLSRQCGFSTFGVPHITDTVARVAALALRTAWRQKYTIHRRLRPEEFAGRVHNRILSLANHPIHPDLLNSQAIAEVFAKWGSYVLPQAYPEGCPAHPAYPSGHATFVGAGVTIVKAFFDESFVIPNPVVPNADGSALLPYVGPPLTVGGELNKLAANVAIGRNYAGVHWRTDAVEGNRLGERVAIGVLTDLKSCYAESFNFTLTTFDGQQVVI
ncbi:MAG: vanadium-dependent haloperoxidase [Candidatus Sumerlaeaceae bacterium]|nr:vanadium-dependent haloperoxidase [Candidatus Sumerlaeaceae bacterium]